MLRPPNLKQEDPRLLRCPNIALLPMKVPTVWNKSKFNLNLIFAAFDTYSETRLRVSL